MPDTGQHRPDPSDGTSAAVPTTAEALARLDMPLLEAMMTQRAVRRVLPDPVDDAVVLKCIELALRAPTGNDGQNWEFIVVKDRHVKEKLAKRYRQAWKLQYGVVIRRVVARDESMAKIVRAVQWQVDHFTEIPVLVVACLRLGAREGRVAVRADAACGRVGILGIDLSQCAEPVTRRACHGPGCVPDHLAAVEPDFGAQRPSICRRP